MQDARSIAKPGAHWHGSCSSSSAPGFSETEPFFHGIETLLRLDAVHRIFISDMPGSPYNENKDKDQ